MVDHIFTGLTLAWLIILLVNRNSELNYMILFLCIIFPAWEIIFTVIRRCFFKQNIFRPDLLHFHSLLNRYMKLKLVKPGFETYSNSLSSTLILLFLVIFYTSIFKLTFFNINSFDLIIFFIIVYLTIYIISYEYLIKKIKFIDILIKYYD